MKKKLLITALAATVVTVGGVGYALTMKKVQPVAQQAAPVSEFQETQKAEVTPTETVENNEPVSTVSETPVNIAPQEPDVKTRIMDEIKAFAVSKGWDENMVYGQTSCMDRAITQYVGYDSYDKVKGFTLVDMYLNGRVEDGGKMYLMFDNAGTCAARYYTVPN